MNNMFKYIRDYGELTFEEKPITIVDILIFSQLPYLDFSNIFTSKYETVKLSDIWTKLRNKNIGIEGLSQRTTMKLLNIISTKKRYKDLLLKNYIYILKEDTQFGAISIIVPNDKVYVAFEGTDTTLWGWKEDFKLTYTYPTESQKLAAKYLNQTIKLTGPNIVVCGHSKGGNLALVGAMRTNIFKKYKIKQVYSFDGPGLKKEEFKSFNYKLIRNKLINIIPNSSLVGILLEQENNIVIKSRAVGLLQHDVATWVVEEDKLKAAVQDKISKRLDLSISQWLAKHNYKERKEIIEGVFNVLENAGIKDFYEGNRLETIYKIIKASKNMPEDTREVILTSIKLLAADVSSDFINDGKQEIQNKLEQIKKKSGVKM